MLGPNFLQVLLDAALPTLRRDQEHEVRDVLSRLPEAIRDELKSIIERESDEHHLLFSKIQYFRKSPHFNKIPGLELYYLAQRFDMISYGADAKISSEKIISKDLYFWIVTGAIEIRSDDGILRKLGPNDVLCNFSDDDVNLANSTIQTLEETICYGVEGDQLGLLLFDYPDIAQVFLELTTISV